MTIHQSCMRRFSPSAHMQVSWERSGPFSSLGATQGAPPATAVGFFVHFVLLRAAWAEPLFMRM